MCSPTEYTPEPFLVHLRSGSTPFKATRNAKKWVTVYDKRSGQYCCVAF